MIDNKHNDDLAYGYIWDTDRIVIELREIRSAIELAASRAHTVAFLNTEMGGIDKDAMDSARSNSEQIIQLVDALGNYMHIFEEV